MPQQKVEDWMTGTDWKIVLTDLADLKDWSLYAILGNFLAPFASAIPLIGPFVFLARGPVAIFFKYQIDQLFTSFINGYLDPAIYPDEKKYIEIMTQYNNEKDFSRQTDLTDIWQWYATIVYSGFNTIMGLILIGLFLIPLVGPFITSLFGF